MVLQIREQDCYVSHSDAQVKATALLRLASPSSASNNEENRDLYPGKVRL